MRSLGTRPYQILQTMPWTQKDWRISVWKWCKIISLLPDTKGDRGATVIKVLY